MDGAMQSQLSVVNSDMKTISVTSLKRDPIPDWAIKLNSKKHSQNMDELFNLNTTLMEDGAIINISNNKAIADTIYIIHVGNNDGFYNYRHMINVQNGAHVNICLLYTSPSPRDRQKSRMPSSA